MTHAISAATLLQQRSLLQSRVVLVCGGCPVSSRACLWHARLLVAFGVLPPPCRAGVLGSASPNADCESLPFRRASSLKLRNQEVLCQAREMGEWVSGGAGLLLLSRFRGNSTKQAPFCLPICSSLEEVEFLNLTQSGARFKTLPLGTRCGSCHAQNVDAAAPRP